MPFKYGFEFSLAAVIGFCLMSFVSAVETVGDVSGIIKGVAGRKATEKEIKGETYADGIGTAVAGLFGGLPNTSFSQNVGLIAMTGVMRRHVVTYGAVILIVCGLIPKVGALVRTIPIEVPGGGVIVMFDMIVSAGMSNGIAGTWLFSTSRSQSNLDCNCSRKQYNACRTSFAF